MSSTKVDCVFRGWFILYHLFVFLFPVEILFWLNLVKHGNCMFIHYKGTKSIYCTEYFSFILVTIITGLTITI